MHYLFSIRYTNIFLCCLISFISFQGFCQIHDSIIDYFDATWHSCDSSEAVYFRTGKWNQKGFQVKDYYKSSRAIQMIGYFTNEKQIVKTDTAIFFFENGSVSSTGKYVNNNRAGFWIFYFEPERMDCEGYYNDEIQDGKWVYYHRNGIISSLEFYNNGELSKMKCWDENGNALSVCYETMLPTFQGDLNEFLNNNISYPETARQDGIQGKVVATFQINPDGKVSNIEIVKSLRWDCDLEVIRIIELMPPWKYYPNHNRNCPIKHTLPVTFKFR